MSYSSDAKAELCRVKPASICCHLAELSGIVCAAGSVMIRPGGERRLVVETENEDVARRTATLLQSVFEVTPVVVTGEQARLGGRRVLRIVLFGGEAEFVLHGCGIDLAGRRTVPREVTARKCCRRSFLRGVFLARGSVTDPKKDYHLEFVLDDGVFAESLVHLISRFHLAAKSTARRRMTLVYLKGQQDITDLLSLMGAQSARFAMEDATVRKSFRNMVNRAVNCDSANVSRALAASERQEAAIRAVFARSGRSSLPRPLMEIADLRLANPELSLEELGRLCDPPIGKSGAGHRLSRLMAMAEGPGA